MNRTEPWLVEEANIHLQKKLDDFKYTAKVLEVGMGSSSLYFLARAELLVSIEHDPKFYYQLYYLIIMLCAFGKPGPYPKLILADRPYNNKIDELENNFFDIILIDGRDRVKCIESAIPKLKSGGWLILDNSERPYYQRGIDLMQGWERRDYYQPEPDKYGFTYPDWKTSIFIKP